jgi:WD40 repeat protein
MSISTDAPPGPFKGLAAFQDTELDALLFHGREREREVVVANLLASRLTVLYGASGAGKTSLLRAAVANSIRRTHDAAVVFYSSWAGDPRAGLAAAIDEAVGIEATGTLTERLRAASEAVGGEVYVILDQFEEYFLYHERDAFAEELAEAISEPGLRANFLIGLREDALAKLDAFKGRIPNLFANYLRLDHLDRSGARAAILGPIKRYNELADQDVRVEPELVDAVLDQVAAGKVDVGRAGRGGVEADEERIEAPYLQLVLERLWEAERERGSSVLRLTTLAELGGAEAIVRAHLERALGRLEPAQQDVAATVFGHLVTPTGSKIAHRPGDLAQYAAVPEAEVRPVLDALGRERILRAVDGAGGGERYEIFHDVLADGVLAWRARRELERDREQARSRQRRLAVVAAAALLALAAMTAVAIWAFAERSHARSSARQARARALEATALAELPTDPQRALADAVKVARSSPSGRVAAVLRQALLEAHLRRVLPARNSVSVVSFAPRGGRMLSAAADGRVRVYSSSGTLERILSTGAPVTAASFSPSGDLVLTAAGHRVSVWDAAHGRRLRELALPGVATSATFDHDGRLFLTTSERGGATVWRTATGRRLAALRRPGSALAGAFSPDGRLVATIVRKDKAPARGFVFDTRSGRLLHVLAPKIGLKSVAFAAHGSLLATASYKGTYLWNPRTGRLVHVLDDSGKSQKTSPMNDAEFSPDGTMLAVAGQDDAVRVWNVSDGTRLFYFPLHTSSVVEVAWSQDGRFLADASNDRTSQVWEVKGVDVGKRVADLVGHDDAVRSVAYSPDGRSVLTGSADGTARLWDADFEQDLRPLGVHPGGAVTASFGAGGRLVISAGRDKKARIWDTRNGHLLYTMWDAGGVNDARLSPDGRLAVTGSDWRAEIWNEKRPAPLRTLREGDSVRVARFSRDGARIVTGDAKGNVQLWRTRDGRLLWTKRQRGPVMDAAFASDGQTLVAAGGDGASIWSVPAGTRVRLASPGGATRVAFSPDGSLVATAGGDGSARLWDAATGALRHVLRVSKAALTGVVFSPDGRLLLTTGSPPHNVLTWDVRTGKQVDALVGQNGPVSAGAFSPDGRWIVTAGPLSAALWRTGTNQPYLYLRGDTGPLTSVSFSPDGRLVLSSSEDGSVRLYRCEICGNLKALIRIATRRLAAR